MAALIRQLQTRVATVTETVAKYNKRVLEKNKHYVADNPTIEKCQELSKQLFYTRLASLPVRYNEMWKELDHLKAKLTHRNDLELEDLGVSILFLVECYGWFCMGEIVGRGGTVTGYKV
ncbi:hypothetical protein M758_6G059300 [Ceratodon purpureus]|uniref:Uncharacterized protein n=1 Tax=Ceratodon purpureus TaxID=3225 RepID=A0A8T0HF21_CERPU|nr:hypothetical protein KC19_6G063400 [Ceratodon purpureus]KAG0612879.1 hypothetical protein M758_6G059300 [Ceratodon purpureus]